MMGNPKQQTSMNFFELQVALLGEKHNLRRKYFLRIDKALLGNNSGDQIHFWNKMIEFIQCLFSIFENGYEQHPSVPTVSS